MLVFSRCILTRAFRIPVKRKVRLEVIEVALKKYLFFKSGSYLFSII
jgi:hypothetical protein